MFMFPRRRDPVRGEPRNADCCDFTGIQRAFRHQLIRGRIHRSVPCFAINAFFDEMRCLVNQILHRAESECHSCSVLATDRIMPTTTPRPLYAYSWRVIHTCTHIHARTLMIYSGSKRTFALVILPLLHVVLYSMEHYPRKLLLMANVYFYLRQHARLLFAHIAGAVSPVYWAQGKQILLSRWPPLMPTVY